MSFDQYIDRLCAALELDRSCFRDGSESLYDDVGLDSLQAFELVLFTEELAGLSVPPPNIPMIFTSGDAYSYYLFAQALAIENEGD